MSYKLFLDDFREVKQAADYMYSRIGADNYVYHNEDWLIAKNYDDFVDIVNEHGIPDLISYDHDLADEHYAPKDQYADYNSWAKTREFTEKTGLDCAKWMVEYCRKQGVKHPAYFVHSMNPVGVANIKNYLQ